MNVLLVGLGGIGMGYDIHQKDCIQTHARAIDRAGPSLFCAVDPDASARLTFEKHYQWRAYVSCDLLPSDIHWDLIVIASPTQQHLWDIQWAYRQKPVVILVEKPLTQSLRELREVETLVASGNVNVMVNLIRNYDPDTAQALRRFDSTRPISGVVHYSKGFVHNGIHFLTLLMKHFGTLVSGMLLQSDHRGVVARLQIGVVDVVFLPNEQASSLNGMSLRQGGMEVTLVDGGRYILTADGGEPLLRINAGFKEYQANVFEQVKRVMAGDGDDSFALTIQAQRLMMGLMDGRRVNV
ncbi:MAG: Gfo/Idh/MocA family oxidoreductase [Saccharospirillum sp.]